MLKQSSGKCQWMNIWRLQAETISNLLLSKQLSFSFKILRFSCKPKFQPYQYSKACFICNSKINIPSHLGPLPTFTSPQSNFSAIVGTEARLLCRVNDFSTSWWTRNGTTLKRTNKYRIKPNKYLKIRKVGKSDGGEYICWARNGYGVRKRAINLVVEGIKFWRVFNYQFID